MSDENLEQRVTAVEAEVEEVRREAAAARALASGSDRDVADYRAEMRAHTRGLEALRQTQIEHYAEHKAEFSRVDTRLGHLETGFARFEVGLAGVQVGLAGVESGLAGVAAGVQHIARLIEEPRGGSGAPAAVS